MRQPHQDCEARTVQAEVRVKVDDWRRYVEYVTDLAAAVDAEGGLPALSGLASGRRSVPVDVLEEGMCSAAGAGAWVEARGKTRGIAPRRTHVGAGDARDRLRTVPELRGCLFRFEPVAQAA